MVFPRFCCGSQGSWSMGHDLTGSEACVGFKESVIDGSDSPCVSAREGIPTDRFREENPQGDWGNRI